MRPASCIVRMNVVFFACNFTIQQSGEVSEQYGRPVRFVVLTALTLTPHLLNPGASSRICSAHTPVLTTAGLGPRCPKRRMLVPGRGFVGTIVSKRVGLLVLAGGRFGRRFVEERASVLATRD